MPRNPNRRAQNRKAVSLTLDKSLPQRSQPVSHIDRAPQSLRIVPFPQKSKGALTITITVTVVPPPKKPV